MAITKKKNKFSVPQEYNQSVIFAKGGNLYSGIQNGSSQMNIIDNFGKNGNAQAGLGQGLAVVQGATQLGSQIFGNFDTSGIGKEVQSTNDISRGDIYNSNVNVASNKSNVAGESLKGTMTGLQAGMQFGPVGAAIGAGIGLIGGGLSSIFGNSAKQHKADQEAKQWTNNLEAKDRQFNQQDLRSNMANFSAMGGSLYAYGGEMKSPLTEFNTGGRHEDNIQGGIQQGTGANGQPNLVEQGETKHEDYIFSDRLKIDPAVSKEFKLPAGLNGKTFAAESKFLSREGKDRPNDPISNNAIKAQLAKLTAAQEGLKEQMQPQQQQGSSMNGQQFGEGGSIHINPANRGKFNATKKVTGKSTEELTHSKNPLTRKRAIFAQNAAKWSHGDGSDLFANGGEMFIPNPNLQDMDWMVQKSQPLMFANGGRVISTPINNNNFWGYENGKYTPEYTKDVDDILSKDWDTAKKYMTDNNIKYAQTPEGFRAAAFDGKVGDVHKYIYGRHKDTPIDNTTYTHTTDRNFYDSGQLSPEEKALYNPETLTRNITKEEFEKAMKTNNEEVSTTGPGYRQSKNTFAYGGDQTYYNNPTHQGANIYGGPFETPNASNYMNIDKDNPSVWLYRQSEKYPMGANPKSKEIKWDLMDFNNKFPKSFVSQGERPFVDTSNLNKKQTSKIDSQSKTTDYSRYAPVAANMITGIGDMFQTPEVVKYGRVSPEMNTSHFDYQPIDTEWMNNKMNATYAGTRDQMINNAGGNRAVAMAGLSGINQQQQNAVGEAYLKAQDINYGRKQQANQFNAGIESQNVQAQNQAQQLNLQIAIQEAEMNARNRAAKRNAARQAIIQSANDLGQIGKENYFGNITTKSTGYNPLDNLKYTR